jgi:hypothetical protein
MNDNDTLAVVRDSLTTAKDSLAGIHMDTPPQDIARAGRARHRSHRLTGLTGAVAVIAGTALTVAALAPSGHPAAQSGDSASQSGHSASHLGTAQLAAWTVAKQLNGDIKVTLRQLSDPSGLQSTLRADGVPANVTSLGQLDPSCRPYPMTQALFESVYEGQKAAGSGATILTIHPSALPSGAGVQIGAATGQQVGDRALPQAAGNQTIHHSVHQPAHQVAAGARNVALRVGLVYASGQCTGS